MKRPRMSVADGEPYEFICYSHSDSDAVYADLSSLADNGVHFWFDEGIPAGKSWRAEIAAAIRGANSFIFYVSRASLASTHCIREVEFALDHDVDIVPIYLESCALPEELGLALNRVQALFRYSDGNYESHLLNAVRAGTGTTNVIAHAPRARRRLLLMALAILVAAAGMFSWQRWNPASEAKPAALAQQPAPHAHERYLEGLELVARWDKDDNLERAVALFEEAIMLNPGFALARARLADALRLQSILTGDDSLLQRAEEEASVAVRQGPELAPVQVALGRIHAALGNQDLAFAALDRAISIDPNDAPANQSIAKMYERQGRLEDAEAAFGKAITLAPDDLRIRDSYANFLFRQGRYEAAAEQWRSLIEQAPDHFGALVNLGSALNSMGNIPEAILMYERAIAVRPSYMAYTSLGAAYWRAGQYQDAVDAINEALAMDDSDSLAWGNLAYAYSWMNGEERQAAEAFSRAISLAEADRERHPRDPYVHSDLALYYAKTGQDALALQRLETALALSPDSGEILAAAAEAFETLGERERAVELANKSLAMGYPLQRFRTNPEISGLLSDPRMQALQ